MAGTKPSVKDFLFLHAILILYSFSGVFSKLAAGKEFLSLPFLLLYGTVLAFMFVYALLWQQALKKMPLTTAFSNKSVITVWGMLWGALFFHEKITWLMIVGALVIFAGVYLVVTDDE